MLLDASNLWDHWGQGFQSKEANLIWTGTNLTLAPRRNVAVEEQAQACLIVLMETAACVMSEQHSSSCTMSIRVYHKCRCAGQHCVSAKKFCACLQICPCGRASTAGCPQGCGCSEEAECALHGVPSSGVPDHRGVDGFGAWGSSSSSCSPGGLPIFCITHLYIAVLLQPSCKGMPHIHALFHIQSLVKKGIVHRIWNCFSSDSTSFLSFSEAT